MDQISITKYSSHYVGLALLFFSGCASMNGAVDLSVLKKQVSDDVRIGMTRQDSAKVMKTLGFECSYKSNETLRYYESNEAISKSKIENIDFLECNAKQQDGMVTEFLKVALVIEKGVVARIIYVSEFIGP